ncbi:hypothetical protein FACS189431_0560 [Alphaproteobacteria bacterium]|nr:hypothetical protein FACS189431_0560 [Alphaproteobacteria bacterium]
MKNLIINSKTRANLEAYLAHPTHALLLAGKNGVGLGTIAKSLGKAIAGADTVIISPKLHKTQKTATINVDDIRALADLTRDRRTAPLAIVIDEADRMTDKAPEAFLKALEEPNEHVHYILASHTPEKLPDTILSRVQKIEVLPVAKDDYQPMFENIKIPARRKQIEFLAAGLPAEIQRLSVDEDYFRAKVRDFENAKQFLTASTYGRLRHISAIKTREAALTFTDALAHLSMILAEKQPNPDNLALISDVIDNLHQNGNIRTQLTYLATNMVQ